MTHRNAPLSLLTWLCRWSLVTASAGAAVSSKLPIAVSMVAIWRMLPAALASAVRGIEDLAPGRLTVTRGPWHECATHLRPINGGPVRNRPSVPSVPRRQCLLRPLTHESASQLSEGELSVAPENPRRGHCAMAVDQSRRDLF